MRRIVGEFLCINEGPRFKTVFFYRKLHVDSYKNLRHIHKDFTITSKFVNENSSSKFVLGGPKEKPLHYYLDISTDILIYFAAYHKNVDICIGKIALRRTESIEKLLKSLNVSEGFNALLDLYMLNCRCLVQDGDKKCLRKG